MKIRTSILALILIMAILLTTPAFAAENAEPVKLTVAVSQHTVDTTDPKDFGSKYALKKACEELGYEIEWIVISEDTSTLQEKLSTLLAGDLPDVIWGPLYDNEQLVIDNRSLFVPLEDKLDSYAPDIVRVLNEYMPDWQSYLTHDDGHIYSLPGFILENRNSQVDGVGYINKVWLENLGLDMPTTTTELETVLAAFRDQDANGNGDPNDEIPLDYCHNNWSSRIEEIAHWFGVTLRNKCLYDIVDGKVVSSVDTDAFRTYLEYFNYLTKEKLVNPEGVSQTTEQYNSNIANGKDGIFYGWHPMTFITDSELANQYVALPPISAEGYTYRVIPSGSNARRANYLITTACTNVEAALNLYNYFFTDEQKALEAFDGPEGLYWEYDANGYPTNRNVTKEEAIAFGLSPELAELAGTSSFASTLGMTNNSPLIVRAVAAVEGSGNSFREKGIAMLEEYYSEQTMSQALIPAEITEEFTFATDGLVDYVYSFACDAIINGVTDDTWNAYVAGLSRYGFEAYLEYYQNLLDGTF